MDRTTRIRALALLALAPALVAGIMLAITFAPVSTPGTAHAGVDVCPANPSPPDPDDPSMVVDTPSPNDTVTSPVTISGQARTFEANVQIRILDESGTAIVETFTTAAEAAPALSPFSEDVAFTVAMTQPGCVEVFEESAEDGSPVNVVQVPVTLQAPEATPPVEATATQPAVVPPPTGTGSTGGSTSAWTIAAIAGVLLLAVALPAAALARRRS